MSSRLLKAIDKRIAKTRDPIENACLRAERAALLARQGLLDEARAELRRIHAQFDSRPNARVSAWTSLAEGLVAFFESLTTSARDKAMRALVLGTAARDLRIRALSAAWLAHFDYLEQRFEPMLRHLSIAVVEAPNDASSVHARASLVVAEAYHWSERLDLAQPWYSRARVVATQDGDETIVSALMHNMAWLRAVHARRLDVSGEADRAEVRTALLGAESIESFDKRVGTGSLHSLVPILRAHVLALLERYAEAVALFEQHFAKALSEGLGQTQCSLHAELAWCQLMSGNREAALTSVAEALAHLLTCTQPDERAATHGRLRQIFLAIGDSARAEEHRALATSEWQAHSQRQSVLLAALPAAVGTCPQPK